MSGKGVGTGTLPPFVQARCAASFGEGGGGEAGGEGGGGRRREADLQTPPIHLHHHPAHHPVLTHTPIIFEKMGTLFQHPSTQYGQILVHLCPTHLVPPLSARNDAIWVGEHWNKVEPHLGQACITLSSAG